MDEKRIKNLMTRREFLVGSVAAGAVLAPGCAQLFGKKTPKLAGPVGRISANEKISLAAIGAGGKGASDIEGMNATGHVNIVALCDVDWSGEGHARMKARFPQAKCYQDFRVMLDEMDSQIDAVTISTPDHIHAPAAMDAMRRGKHVFCQKPLTHSIHEARLLTQTARERSVATLMGIQGHSTEGIRLVKEWIEQGAIGNVREVHVWTNRPIWPQGIERPDRVDPIPDGLNWDLWIGPAPMRPFVSDTYHPFKWRGWLDFGSGAIGDIACHALDASFWALDLGYPTSVEAVSSPLNQETFPSWSVITFEFPKRGKRLPLKLVWFDGVKTVDGQQVQNMPPRPPELEADRQLQDNGQIYYGDDGVLMAGSLAESPRIIPETRMKDFLASKPKKTLPRSHGHYMEFAEACKGVQPAGANFDYAGPLTELAHLGNMAMRAGTRIEFDPAAMRITNNEEANQFLKREYREGWRLEARG